MTIAVLHQKAFDLFFEIRVDRLKLHERRVPVKSLRRLSRLIQPGNVMMETSNEHVSLYQLKTRHHEKA